jgi:hypothetical protein
MKKLLTIIVTSAALTACGTSEVMKSGDNTFTVQSQYGSVNGSWARAESEARTKATDFCAQTGQQAIVLNESKAGVLGWSPQSSTVTFRCTVNIAAISKTVQDECSNALATSELDVIRDKVELIRATNDSPVPFAIATNNQFPTLAERTAIAKWAKIREECMAKMDAAINEPAVGTPLQITFTQQLRSFRTQTGARVSELIVALYQSKLSYGEFAQKREEITAKIAAAEREFRASVLLADRDIQMRSQQLAQQQLQNNLSAWSTYMQSVNARQPQTVNVNGQIRLQSNCRSTVVGNTATTNCN